MAKEDDGGLILGASDRVELLATIVMALAAIFTAWSAFESAKWSGHQAIEFSNANAARVESTRADTTAGRQTVIDVELFTDWLNALNDELRTGEIELTAGTRYSPRAGSLSAFYFQRMRDEFKPALEAWLETRPLLDPDAPASPFEMNEYVLVEAERADALLLDAQASREKALEANQNSDDYVLTTVQFALVIFFAGVSSKLTDQRNRWIAILLAVGLFVWGVISVLSLPIIWPF